MMLIFNRRTFECREVIKMDGKWEKLGYLYAEKIGGQLKFYVRGSKEPWIPFPQPLKRKEGAC